MKPTKNRIFCNDCNRPKMLFETKRAALKFIEFNQDTILEESGKAPVRAYYCKSCGGWHLTSRMQRNIGKTKEEQRLEVIELFVKIEELIKIYNQEQDEYNKIQIIKKTRDIYYFLKKSHNSSQEKQFNKIVTDLALIDTNFCETDTPEHCLISIRAFFQKMDKYRKAADFSLCCMMLNKAIRTFHQTCCKGISPVDRQNLYTAIMERTITIQQCMYTKYQIMQLENIISTLDDEPDDAAFVAMVKNCRTIFSQLKMNHESELGREIMKKMSAYDAHCCKDKTLERRESYIQNFISRSDYFESINHYDSAIMMLDNAFEILKTIRNKKNASQIYSKYKTELNQRVSYIQISILAEEKIKEFGDLLEMAEKETDEISAILLIRKCRELYNSIKSNRKVRQQDTFHELTHKLALLDTNFCEIETPGDCIITIKAFIEKSDRFEAANNYNLSIQMLGKAIDVLNMTESRESATDEYSIYETEIKQRINRIQYSLTNKQQ